MADLASYALLGTVIAGAFLSLGAVLGLGFARLESQLGFVRDGLERGAEAPRWTAEDSMGRDVASPGAGWQLLVFGDHSLVEFPDLLKGMTILLGSADVELVVATRYPAILVHEVLPGEVREVARIVEVSDEFYDTYNVRAMPFVLVVDPAGVVGGGGMFDNAASLIHVCRFAGVPMRDGERAVLEGVA